MHYNLYVLICHYLIQLTLESVKEERESMIKKDYPKIVTLVLMFELILVLC